MARPDHHPENQPVLDVDDGHQQENEQDDRGADKQTTSRAGPLDCSAKTQA